MKYVLAIALPAVNISSLLCEISKHFSGVRSNDRVSPD
jgi:hypothetical protein